MFNFIKKFLLISVACSTLHSTAFADSSDYAYTNINNALKGVEVKISLSTVPPFVIVKSDEYTEPVGIDVEIFRELQKRLGFTMPNDKFVYTSLNDKYTLLNNNEVDVIGGGISASPQRAKIFNFSKSYYQSSFAVVIHNDNKNIIKGVQDLKGKTLAAEYGISYNGLFDGAETLKTEPFLTTFSCFYAVANRQVDATIFDLPTAQYYTHFWEGGNITIAGEPFGKSKTSRIVFLFNKNFKYQREFNIAIEQMIQDGTIDKIIKKYS